MKQLFIVANWKSNKTIPQTREWFAVISNSIHSTNSGQEFQISNKEIIVCPPFTALSMAKSLIDQYKLPIKLGAQDISPFRQGAYTGEVNGKQIREFADYVIIGHSERRIKFQESNEMLTQKVAMAKEHGLTPIFCVQDAQTQIPDGVTIVAYEPVFAIGSGNPDTPENADSVAKIIKQKGIEYVLYGGSVKPENVVNFTSMLSIDGILVGGASLDAQTFSSIIKNA